jgi:hypothetical protein
MNDNRLTLGRIERAYVGTGYLPVYGLFFGGREESQKYACPVCAVVRHEHGVILGPRGRNKSRDEEPKGVAYAAEKLGMSQSYVGSFMTAYDGLRYDSYFESSDDQGLRDGEAARLEFPPEWGR